MVDRGLSGRANLELHARLWGVEPRPRGRRIAELTEALGLTELIGRPAGSYSGGERRRLEIARALVSQPRVLFLDEPTVGLDPRIRHELLDVIGGLRAREGMTILLTTHYLDEAQRLCDRVAIIHLGEIVALDTPWALLAGLGSVILELRLDGDVPAALESLRDRGVAGRDAFAIGVDDHACRCTTARRGRGASRDRRRRHPRRSVSARARRRSTTSTCNLTGARIDAAA